MRLSAEKVTKTIKGKTILDAVDLELYGGNVYGFVGRNGSGKTMLFRALSGLMKIDSGSISLDGKFLHSDFSVLPDLGIVLENTGLFSDLTGYENLEYFASFKKVASKDDIVKAISRVGLDPDDKCTYGKYSLGMKQRLAIAQAVMEKPMVLMLDEPTNGLDQDGVELIRKLILEEKERGALVLLASHNKEDIELLSDHVFQIESGRVSKAADHA